MNLPTEQSGELAPIEDELADSTDDIEEDLMGIARNYPSKTKEIAEKIFTTIEFIFNTKTALNVKKKVFNFLCDCNSIYCREILRSIPMFCFSRENDIIDELIYTFNNKIFTQKILEIIDVLAEGKEQA